jgi:SanA protein
MKKKIIWLLFALIVLVIGIMWIADLKINKSADGLVYSNLTSIPYNKVGLLLGTSRLLVNGQPNQYFINRIKATADLYLAHKIDIIVISGDNSRNDYNEPMDMKNELIKSGIPENRIYLDYAGFRTYDSVIRLDKIFGQSKFTIISQGFQNRRAIFISKHLGLDAIGYNAKDVDAYSGFKTKLREKFARVKVFLDLLTDKEPKFLGERIEIK